jgi:transposase
LPADSPHFSHEQLAAENAELRGDRGVTGGGQHSQNSFKPSSDSAFAKPTPKSLCRKSGRKPGGQPGHPQWTGSTLSIVDDLDETLFNARSAITR